MLDIPDFNKIFANVEGTYIEYDTTGDQVFDHHEYNPTGLIRIHLKDGHPLLGPSDGCAVGGVYYKFGSGVNYAVGPAWKDASGNWTKLADMINLRVGVDILEETIDKAVIRFVYRIAPKDAGKPVTVTETITVLPNQVFVEDRVMGEDVEQVRVYYPMLAFDGRSKTQVDMNRTTLRMQLDEKNSQL